MYKWLHGLWLPITKAWNWYSNNLKSLEISNDRIYTTKFRLETVLASVSSKKCKEAQSRLTEDEEMVVLLHFHSEVLRTLSTSCYNPKTINFSQFRSELTACNDLHAIIHWMSLWNIFYQFTSKCKIQGSVSD